MRITKAVLLTGILLALPALASATTLTEFTSGNITGSSSLTGIAGFNPALGTLTSVEVTITGTLSATLLTTPTIGPGGVPIPMPYTVSINQNFTGSPSHDLFSFASPSTFMFSGISTGGTQVVTSTFNYTFHFNGTTDIVGFAGVSASGSAPLIPPGLAFGTLAGFTGSAIPLSELVLTSPGVSVGATVTSASSTGGILVEYDYTPASTAPVPEPCGFMLLGVGFAGLAFASRR
jgi:hypothetical protein